MHTVIVVAAGLSMLLACLLLGHAWGGMPGLVTGTKLFFALWFLTAFANMYIGTTHGYTWGQEFPIFLAVFAIPAVVSTAEFPHIRALAEKGEALPAFQQYPLG